MFKINKTIINDELKKRKMLENIETDDNILDEENCSECCGGKCQFKEEFEED